MLFRKRTLFVTLRSGRLFSGDTAFGPIGGVPEVYSEYDFFDENYIRFKKYVPFRRSIIKGILFKYNVRPLVIFQINLFIFDMCFAILLSIYFYGGWNESDH